eukprot:GDKH01024781.1.p1 GENE.GDKH01024781.1~~GDKH01024781.1.p1  ORF type:complete len:170 (-),score=17.67 GDKH01024781.1:331-840(-)
MPHRKGTVAPTGGGKNKCPYTFEVLLGEKHDAFTARRDLVKWKDDHLGEEVPPEVLLTPDQQRRILGQCDCGEPIIDHESASHASAQDSVLPDSEEMMRALGEVKIAIRSVQDTLGASKKEELQKLADGKAAEKKTIGRWHSRYLAWLGSSWSQCGASRLWTLTKTKHL